MTNCEATAKYIKFIIEGCKTQDEAINKISIFFTYLNKINIFEKENFHILETIAKDMLENFEIIKDYDAVEKVQELKKKIFYDIINKAKEEGRYSSAVVCGAEHAAGFRDDFID